MAMTRRTAIASMAAASIFSVLETSCNRSKPSHSVLATATDNTLVRVLLHGLFFLEFKADKNLLYATAPQVAIKTNSCTTVTTPHDYVGGTRRNLSSDLQGTVDLTGFTAGVKNRFPDELIQFDKSVTQVGSVTDDPTKFHLRLILNNPQQIYSVRRANGDGFRAVQNNVGKNLQKSRIVGLVTCLEYSCNVPGLPPLPSGPDKWQASLNLHMHAEPPTPDPGDSYGINHMNAALCQAAVLFSGSKPFDLQIDPTSTPPKALAEDPKVTGLGVVDELAYAEPEALAGTGTGAMSGMNVANCVQFGVI